MKSRNPKEFREILASGRWFSGLSADEQDALLGIAQVLSLHPGARLFSRGDEPSGLYAVLSGSIRITAATESGKEALLTLAEPPGWFGEIAVFDGRPRTHDAIADEESLVLHVPHEPLGALLAAQPILYRSLGLMMCAKLRLAFLAMEEIVVLPLPVRVARRLVLMASGYGEWKGHSKRVLEVRQEQLATMLGTSRQSANQSLKDLEARGWVRVSYGEIEILDLAALATFAGA